MKTAYSKTVRIGACQTPDLQNIDTAILCIHHFVSKAEEQNIRLLCFPECFLQGYVVEKDFIETHSLETDSATFREVLGRLPNTSMVLVIGMIEREGNEFFNTAIVIQNGQLKGKYRKTHLLTGERTLSAGSEYPIFEVDGLKFGINICYDTNFPEAAFAVARQDARLIVCPANNMMGYEKAAVYKDLHNEVRAERTRETGLWLISSDVTGEKEHRISYGPTAIIDPTGVTVCQVPLGAVDIVYKDVVV